MNSSLWAATCVEYLSLFHERCETNVPKQCSIDPPPSHCQVSVFGLRSMGLHEVQSKNSGPMRFHELYQRGKETRMCADINC